MDSLKIELTIDEANKLILLINDAVKSRGLEVSKTASLFVDKIHSAFALVNSGDKQSLDSESSELSET